MAKRTTPQVLTSEKLAKQLKFTNQYRGANLVTVPDQILRFLDAEYVLDDEVQEIYDRLLGD
jgi:hypothetical protein